MPRPIPRAPVLVFGVLFLGCAALKGAYSVPARHPEDLPGGRPLCSAADCHQGSREPLPYARFDHTAAFADGSHRAEAYQQSRVCAMCHGQAFCNDCHSSRVELKPSAKDPTGTARRAPHRGDYLSRHRIDARLDPTSCFRCHGNPKSAQTCARCHGK